MNIGNSLKRGSFIPRDHRRILVLAIRGIGDMVLITPLLRLLKQRACAEYLAVMADGVTAEVFDHNPHIDRLFVIDRSRSRQLPWISGLREWASLVSDLRHEQFDTAIDVFSGPRSASLAFLCGADDRYGEDFRTSGRGFLYNYPTTIVRDGRHIVEQKLDLVRPLVRDIDDDVELEIVTTTSERDHANATLSQLGSAKPRRVGLFPGGKDNFMWPAERFASVGDWLIKTYNAEVMLFGGPRDISVCKRVSEKMASTPIDLSGKTTLRELIALLAEVDLVISNVTGPMHIAVALKKPKVVALYGAADTVQYAPWGASSIMLTKGSPGDAYWRKVDYHRDFEFLLNITVDDVCDRVQPLMEALTVSETHA
ncbi:MAG TPA: glycosyltransferase family 9 protein [Nitrospirales bacterium]|nr:glycosyltransferase family 9 protein [Nitrospirales bacterium]HIN32940.1 glycosyltransferase family 9 protein [Nitrospirales bacterium]HIO69879.1 glycosyltransferase family 9 protein [Nitrospirales bacterium]